MASVVEMQHLIFIEFLLAYEEDADGFGFSRKRSKRVAQKDPSPAPEQQASKATRAPPGKRKEDSLEAPSIGGTAPTRRKSSRLSGENPQLQLEELPKSKLKKSRKNGSDPETNEPPGSISPPPGNILIEKRRKSLHKKIPLPFADTPVITRNKEMRKTSAQAHRRSSSGMRGNRASSLIDSGTSNGEQDDDLVRGTWRLIHAQPYLTVRWIHLSFTSTFPKISLSRGE